LSWIIVYVKVVYSFLVSFKGLYHPFLPLLERLLAMECCIGIVVAYRCRRESEKHEGGSFIVKGFFVVVFQQVLGSRFKPLCFVKMR
jgi:hypothetical protein